VSEVEVWILPDFVRHIMGEASERSLQQVMESLFARQSEEMKASQAEIKAAQAKMKADVNANMEANQERANVELKAAQAEIEARAEARHER
jgi:Skp family chaperone for outer membrane proteins